MAAYYITKPDDSTSSPVGSFADAVSLAAPSVVNIYTKKANPAYTNAQPAII